MNHKIKQDTIRNMWSLWVKGVEFFQCKRNCVISDVYGSVVLNNLAKWSHTICTCIFSKNKWEEYSTEWEKVGVKWKEEDVRLVILQQKHLDARDIPLCWSLRSTEILFWINLQRKIEMVGVSNSFQIAPSNGCLWCFTLILAQVEATENFHWESNLHLGMSSSMSRMRVGQIWFTTHKSSSLVSLIICSNFSISHCLSFHKNPHYSTP